MEHWSTPLQIPSISLKGYTMAASYCRPTRQHGGTAIYVRSCYTFEEIEHVKKFTIELQCEFCAITLKNVSSNISIVSVYRPPGGNLELFFNTLSYVLDFCLTGSKTIFICGDFNINYFDSHNYLNYFILSFNLNVTSEEATRVFVNRNGSISSTKIDYILTNANQKLVKTTVHDCDIADHRAIKLQYFHDSNTLPTKPVTRTYRLLSEENLRCLHLRTERTFFNSVFDHTDLNSAFNEFLSILTSLIDSSCPVRRSRFGNYVRHHWITSEIRQAASDLKNLHWLLRNSNSPNVKALYSSAKKEYTFLLKATKNTYYKNLLLSSSNKNKTVWKIVKDEMCLNSQNEKIALKIDGNVVSDCGEVAEAFARYFSTIGKRSVYEHYGAYNSTSCTTERLADINFFFFPVMPEEVLRVIKSLKTRKAVDMTWFR